MNTLFQSFFQGGFESACHVTRHGTRLDMTSVIHHDRYALQDYQLLRSVGMRTARDGVRWHLIERAGTFDFSSLAPLLHAAQQQGMQIIWTLCHYGWPEDVDVFHPSFVDRFARFCHHLARFVSEHDNAVPFYAPINEISFLSWAAGDQALIFPCAQGRGPELKQQLVRAAIAGMEAIWSVDARARMVHVDPIMHVVAPRDRPELAAAAAVQTEGQFEAWDMLAGRAHPELGGAPKYLDIVGVNFYHANQWEFPGADADARLRWEDTPRDDRWVPFHRLFEAVWRRYQRPTFVAETSHFGIGRAPWLREIIQEVQQIQALGIPIEGLCLYPILDRPDWENRDHWHNSGLWDLLPDAQGNLQRVLNLAYAEELRHAQQRLGLLKWLSRLMPLMSRCYVIQQNQKEPR